MGQAHKGYRGLAQHLALSVSSPYNGTENSQKLYRQYISSFLLLAFKASSSAGGWTSLAVFCCLDGGWAPRVPEMSCIRPCGSPATVPSYPTEALPLVGETLTLANPLLIP